MGQVKRAAAALLRRDKLELIGWGLFTASALFFWINAGTMIAALAAATFFAGCIVFLTASLVERRRNK